jgi:hypothetical protein
MTPSITLLGPQRQPTLDRVLASLGIDGQIAAITAGWQERESADTELMGLLDNRGVNLRLHARWMDVLAQDPEWARAEREHTTVLDELQQLYLIRLDHALQATYEIVQRVDGHPRTKAVALEDALEVVRVIDTGHLKRVRELHEAFYASWPPHERDSVARHREEIGQVLSASSSLCIAGGHVGELLKVLHLFNIAPRVPGTLVAWSAGAMALTSSVVLFNDRAAQGPGQTEVYDEGLGLVAGMVLLPHARRRLRTDDATRMSVLARRFAPAQCVVLDDGVSVQLGEAGALPATARVVDLDGRIVEAGAAA